MAKEYDTSKGPIRREGDKLEAPAAACQKRSPKRAKSIGHGTRAVLYMQRSGKRGEHTGTKKVDSAMRCGRVGQAMGDANNDPVQHPKRVSGERKEYVRSPGMHTANVVVSKFNESQSSRRVQVPGRDIITKRTR